MSLPANPSFEIPSHVPPELVKPYPLQNGCTSYEDPFKTIIPEMHRGPAAFYGPGAWQGIENAWVFRREEDLRTLFMEPECFTSNNASPFANLVGESWSVIPVEAGPNQGHRVYRNILATRFTPPRVFALEEKMRHNARSYIAEFRHKGGCEVMQDFAARFPIAVFLDLFGLPLDEVDQFMAWEFVLLHSADMAKITQVVREVKQRILKAMAERQADPKDDLISHVVHSTHDGKPLTEDEAFGICFNLYLGGLDTVTTNIGWQIRHLATDLELQERLRNDPSLIPLAVEEMLRAYSSVAIARTCTRETIVGGVRLCPVTKLCFPPPWGVMILAPMKTLLKLS